MDPTGQTCGEQRFCGSVTTLSTIAIQTGQTQITTSVLQMSISIGRLEDLKVTPGEEGLTGVQVSFNSMRREILEKSFQVLTSYSALQQNLRQLQRIEALQRRGGELREEKEEANQSSQSSRGAMLRLEQLMEILQNQRWKAEQVFRLQLLRALEVQGSKMSESQDQTQLDRNLQPGSRSEVPEPWPWDSRGPRSESGSEQTKKPEMESRPLKTRDVQSSFRSGLKTGSGVKSGPSSEVSTRFRWILIEPGTIYYIQTKTESPAEPKDTELKSVT
ncbi:uncharacterized protein [Nothobranchius furzeri]|uniref:uncharacterized protein n=1 Tax=Nothobranchius furzeri TaxID=105023 RepID=UPI00390494C7